MQNDADALDLLDQIHGAILRADFAQLSSLTPALEKSISHAAQIQDAQLLQKIQQRAQRNAVCLLAAGRGVRAAQRRINELRDIRQGFSTYNDRGQRAQHDQPSHIARRF